MARIDRYKKHYQGAIYHIFNRGVNKENVFIDKGDYFCYLRKIKKYKGPYKVEFINYTLIPNHHHYTLRQLSNIPISKFMHALHSSYARYFNQKHKRIGHLFQDRYKQRIITSLQYFVWLSAYINGNAQIHKLVKDAKDWPYSSYQDYIGLRNGSVCNKNVILNYFKSSEEYSKYTKQVIKTCLNKKEFLKDINSLER